MFWPLTIAVAYLLVATQPTEPLIFDLPTFGPTGPTGTVGVTWAWPLAVTCLPPESVPVTVATLTMPFAAAASAAVATTEQEYIQLSPGSSEPGVASAPVFGPAMLPPRSVQVGSVSTTCAAANDVLPVLVTAMSNVTVSPTFGFCDAALTVFASARPGVSR